MRGRPGGAEGSRRRCTGSDQPPNMRLLRTPCPGLPFSSTYPPLPASLPCPPQAASSSLCTARTRRCRCLAPATCRRWSRRCCMPSETRRTSRRRCALPAPRPGAPPRCPPRLVRAQRRREGGGARRGAAAPAGMPAGPSPCQPPKPVHWARHANTLRPLPPFPAPRCATPSPSWRRALRSSAAPRPCRPTSRTWCRRCWRRWVGGGGGGVGKGGGRPGRVGSRAGVARQCQCSAAAALHGSQSRRSIRHRSPARWLSSHHVGQRLRPRTPLPPLAAGLAARGRGGADAAADAGV